MGKFSRKGRGMEHLFVLPGPPHGLSTDFPRSYPPRPGHAQWRQQWNAACEAASLLVYDTTAALSPVFFLQIGSPERAEALRDHLELMMGCTFFHEPLPAGFPGALERQLLNDVDAFVAAANAQPARLAVAAVLQRTLQRLVNDRVLRAAVAQGQFAPLPYAHVTAENIRGRFLSNSERGFWSDQAKQWAAAAFVPCVQNLRARYVEILG